MRITLLASALLAGTVLAANAAQIKDEGVFPGKNGTEVHGISITGKIVTGDADKFERLANSFQGMAIVGLESPGGIVVEGLIMGELIHKKGFATGVPDNATCASTCGLIWIAGSRRFLSTTSRVGFHAASIDGEVTSTGNALIGAYLTRMDLSYAAVTYLTNASPDSMAWLHPDEARKVGIAFEVNDSEPAKSQAFSAPRPAPATPTGSLASPGYAQGRQARVDYEQWYSALSEGGFRDGATFWATHRSEKPPPSCVGNPQFMTGCVAAKVKLTPSDARRTTDKDFWYGWNSL